MRFSCLQRICRVVVGTLLAELAHPFGSTTCRRHPDTVPDG
jgi:hypothetical protein